MNEELKQKIHQLSVEAAQEICQAAIEAKKNLPDWKRATVDIIVSVLQNVYAPQVAEEIFKAVMQKVESVNGR